MEITETTCVEIRHKALMVPACILPDGTRQDDCASCDYRGTNPSYKGR
ncbi:MAG: hypothetical protein PHH85_02390 [Candidatus Methanoperedens sp.]|nr:hypothetical protein [Candidatus Methanoperedens sp.]